MAGTLNCNGLDFVPVPGNARIGEFYISSTPVTQSFWTDVMGSNPAPQNHARHPVTHVSWKDITGPGGFLDRLNARAKFPGLTFRLPTESEWEYAASGGPHSADGFRFSGSNDIDEVAWYGQKFSGIRRLGSVVFGWRAVSRLSRRHRSTQIHDSGLKKPNQLGVYDMTGNVWEWCDDPCGDGERRLRGGCHHNWDIHCTNVFRYSQPATARGDSIGFRLVLASQ